jgi:hypothetical protein
MHRSWLRSTLCAVAHISGRSTLMAWPFIGICESNYPMVTRLMVMGNGSGYRQRTGICLDLEIATRTSRRIPSKILQVRQPPGS